MRVKIVLCLALAWQVSGNSCEDRLPVVDLGYDLHRALSYDARTQAYTFQNIRYARPPIGDLRFRAPQEPEVNRSSIQTGLVPRTCPQSLPQWQALGGAISSKWTDPSLQFNIEDWVEDFYTTDITSKDVNAGPGGVTEDCLFLDVRVPKKALEAASTSQNGAPVLIWIHGGGYDLGSKQRFPSPQYIPTGLLSRAGENPDSMIFVAINYRLGAFGWLSGPEVERDGDANAGLLDQRLALEWVQQHIHNFGGDSDRVTVMGESAGAGSILLHMMAYGASNSSNHTTSFAQAITQSPYIEPALAPIDGTFANFLSLLNVSNLQEARQLDERILVAANAELIHAAPKNTYLFGPVIDGTYIPERPMKLLREGRFNKSIGVLATHTSLEGAYFFDPSVETEDDFREWVNNSIPGLPEETVAFLAAELYPPIFDGSWGYTSQATRQMSLWGEAFFHCQFTEIGNAKDGESYASEFGVSQGFHTQDLAYIFDFPGDPVPFPNSKDAIQGAIVSFTQTGIPRMSDGSPYPRWGSQGVLVNITETDEYATGDEVNRTRCDWWVHMDV